MNSCKKCCATCAFRTSNMCGNIKNTEFDGMFIPVYVHDDDLCNHYQPNAKTVYKQTQMLKTAASA